MIHDARTFPANQTFEADLCIVGAGAAGIAIAREFIKSGVKVILLESGGLDFDHRTQLLYRGKVTGRNFTPPEFTRRRQFGGSTATWFGRCYPLDDGDFKKHDWLPFSGWAISASELRPYYEKANPLFELDTYEYDQKSEDTKTLIDLKRFSISPPTRFGGKYRDELSKAKNVQVFLYANAVHIQLHQDGSQVSAICCSTLQKNTFSVKSTFHILAMGGLETTRLLLASRDVQTNGIGNQQDLLGRFFMDHVSFFDGAITTDPAHLPKELFKIDYSIQQKNLGTVLAVGLTDAYREKHKMLNACGFFVKRSAHKIEDLFFSKEMQDLIYIADMLRHTVPPSPMVLKNMARSIFNIRTLAPALKNRFMRQTHSSYYGLKIQLECVPNPESRLTLADQRDSLGMPRLNLNWKLSQQDLDSYQRFRIAMFEGLAKMGLPVRPINHDLDAEGWPVSMVPSKHHMGTTRMHKDMKQGVVDEHCRVHGIHNLYIASSSVFPTSGMANPTLTIVALALRIADKVKQHLQG